MSFVILRYDKMFSIIYSHEQMQVLDHDTKFAHLGKPGSAFTPGFERRLGMLIKIVDLSGKKILDVGTGEGVWLGAFTRFTSPENVFGSEYDSELAGQIKQADSEAIRDFHIPKGNVVNCPAEKLEFPDNTFDIVFSHEVLEHVIDDQLSANEAIRVLRPGGKFVVFTPNVGWPFEQHGMFLRGKYYWGNIPLLTWIPFLHKKLAPHVRVYSNRRIKSLFKDLPVRIVHHSYVFPAFDRLSRKWGILGRLIQRFFYLLEKTPLSRFGISHFLVVEKV